MKKINFSISVIVLIFTFGIQNILYCQVTFEQKQNIIINENTGPMLSLKNKDNTAFSELLIENDISKGFSIGTSGSTNVFFDGDPSTPYLFNSSGNDFYFRSSGFERFHFFVDTFLSTTIANFGLSLNKGSTLFLENQDETQQFGITAADDGLSIFRNGTLGDTAIFIDDDTQRVGFGTIKPLGDVDIQQKFLPVTGALNTQTSGSDGLRLNSWNIFGNTLGNLCFVYQSIFRSYIDKTTGNYVNSSDRRFKENISRMDNSLKKINELSPSSYNYIGSDRNTLGFIAQDVEEIFPELVYKNGEYKALAYDNFAVLAIKGIQEQQLIIQSLKHKMELQNSRISRLEKLIEQSSN